MFGYLYYKQVTHLRETRSKWWGEGRKSATVRGAYFGEETGADLFCPQFSSVLLKFSTKIGGNTFIYILGIKQAY